MWHYISFNRTMPRIKAGIKAIHSIPFWTYSIIPVRAQYGRHRNPALPNLTSLFADRNSSSSWSVSSSCLMGSGLAVLSSNSLIFTPEKLLCTGSELICAAEVASSITALRRARMSITQDMQWLTVTAINLTYVYSCLPTWCHSRVSLCLTENHLRKYSMIEDIWLVVLYQETYCHTIAKSDLYNINFEIFSYYKYQLWIIWL